MKATRFEFGGDASALASEIRALAPPLADVAAEVAETIEAVRERGDAAVLELTARFDATESAPESLRVDPVAVEAARGAISEELAAALQLAHDNIARVSEAQLGPAETEVRLPQGQTVTVGEAPVAAAGAYVPGGAAAYPSTALMCCVPAWVAGVERVAVATPPRADGTVHEAVLAACAIAGADEVYAMGGAQAIAALALGTETVAPVDVVVGPGNRFVQEAKRQLAGAIGIDALAGPSELMVLMDGAANLDWVALDLCAQAEHSDDGLLVAAAADATLLDGVESNAAELAAQRSSVEDAPLALVRLGSLEDGVALANALAPEHLELACDRAEVLAAQISTAGSVFTGPEGATAFGDYVAGSNHVLPTGGAGRFSGPLGPRVFRRPTARVEIDLAAAAELAAPLATLARAEGFPVHAESAEARAGGPGGAPKGDGP